MTVKIVVTFWVPTTTRALIFLVDLGYSERHHRVPETEFLVVRGLPKIMGLGLTAVALANAPVNL